MLCLVSATDGKMDEEGDYLSFLLLFLLLRSIYCEVMVRTNDSGVEEKRD